MEHPNELDQQIENLRTLQESFSELAEQASIYNQGRGALAAAISAKGVPTSSDDTLEHMATNISQIQQQINAGVSDFEQVIAPSPYIWNVYAVANDIMNGADVAYLPSYLTEYKQRYGANAFFVGEYYLGYASLELTGADAYLTCDGDFYTIADGVVTHTLPDGTVETYSAASIIHQWHDVESGRCNRWVAFFYLNNAYSFTNTNEGICPRRVAICGECLSFVISGANRLTSVWVIGTLGHFEGGTTGDTWDAAQVIRNYKSHASGVMFAQRELNTLVLPDLETLLAHLFTTPTSSYQNYFADYLSLPNVTTIQNGALVVCAPSSKAPTFIYLPKLKNISVPLIGVYGQYNSTANNGITVIATDIEDIDITSDGGTHPSERGLLSAYETSMNGTIIIKLNSLKRITSGYILHEYGSYRTNFKNVIDIEVGAMETNLYLRSWEATDIVADSDKKAQLIDNIKNHILAKVSDRTDDTQLVFTVSNTMYNAIASETITWNDEEMTLADAFLTKNWLLAGA